MLWRPDADSALEGTPNKFVFSKGYALAPYVSERLLFVTGKLAAPALRDTLGRAELPFDYDVAVMKITVAALMTTDWIARFLEVPEAVTRIMIPGMCEGEIDVLSERFGVPADKGPADLKALPSWFGQADARSGYGERDIRVFAEINHVPRLDRDRILEIAGYYRDAGADVIDLGLSLGRNWLDDGPGVIAELRAAGFELSIDTLDPDEILMADEAGVQYVLSLNGSNRHLAERLSATPVLIPGHARRPRQPRRDDRPPRGARQAVPRRPDHRADRHGVRGEPRPLPRGPPAPSGRGDVHGDRQPHRAHRGRHHGGDRGAHRVLPGARASATSSRPR